MNKGPIKTCFVIIFILVSVLSIAQIQGCSDKDPIKVGFVAGLTGRHYNLGISGRDGVMLAIEEINRAGGVNGHSLELITKDDKQEPDAAKRAVRELLSENVVAIIGHMTSSMQKETLPIINESDIVMISPTVSSSYFEGRDDNFIMLHPSTKVSGKIFSDYAYKTMGLKKITAVYDLSNRTYTESWVNNFRDSFLLSEDTIFNSIAFTSGEQRSFLDLAKQALKQEPDAIVVVANALDTAIISQQVRKISNKVKIMSAEWAFTGDILEQGGSAVEGVVFIQKVNLLSDSPRFASFSKIYEERYGNPPDFASFLAYEAMKSVLFEALKITRYKSEIKGAILNIRKFKGLDSDFEIDGNGDVLRDHYIFTIRGNKFVGIR